MQSLGAMAPLRPKRLGLCLAIAVALVFTSARPAAAGTRVVKPVPTRKTSGKEKTGSRRSASSKSELGKHLAYSRLRIPALEATKSDKAKSDKAKVKARPPRVASKLVIDIGGEGRHPAAINVNPGFTTTTTGRAGRPIPNLVQGVGEKLPFPARAADTIIVENAPLRPETIAELARVIKPGGAVRLVHPSEYAAKVHQAAVRAIGERVHQRTADGVTTTVVAGSTSRPR